jgi:ribosomal protein L14
MIQQETVVNVADNTGAKKVVVHPGHGWLIS